MSMSKGNRGGAARELIVVMKPEARPTASLAEASAPFDSILTPFRAQMKSIGGTAPLASLTSPAVARTGDRTGIAPYWHVVANDEHLDELRDQLSKHPSVEQAYIKPPGRPPALGARVSAPTSTTQDFAPRQDYLDPAPTGVDARYAWGVRGGRGAGVNIIDCEWAWNFSHEDLAQHCAGAVVGTANGDDDHGTSVIGTIIGNDNGFGVTGIAPEAQLATACFDDSAATATSTIIVQAADKLSPGDILLLEIHRPGPNSPVPEQGQIGYIPIEWWPDDFQAILYATKKGIIVVEAGGNGTQNLDDPVYSTPQAGFPTSWRNPFAAGGPDSGAIIVGAGNPPSGTHGRTTDPIGFGEIYVDRARCIYSNHGQRVDCQAWGWEVTTSGGGDLPSSTGLSQTDHNRLYTDIFDGTSSASPIVTGVLACVQGALLAAGRPKLTPSTARQLLRTTGSQQQDGPGRPATERIGSRPDLKALLQSVVLPAPPPAAALAAPAAALAGQGSAGPPLRGIWFLTVVALFGALATAVGMASAGPTIPWLTQKPLLAWVIELGLVSLFFVGIGLQFQNRWAGAAIDSRNKLSLSRFQIVVWSAFFVATLLVACSWNVANGGTIGFTIPDTVWLLMGMSGVSAVGTPLILNRKPAAAPTGAPLAPPGMVSQGVVTARIEGTKPSWADLLLGDELGNATTIDIGKVQQILIGIVAVLSYGLAIVRLFGSTASGHSITALPAMDSGFLALVAAGHATYLSYKAVPHT